MKKAFINSMLLGFVIVSAIIVFIATVGDELVVKNKIIKLKEITDNAVIAMGNHYIISESTTAAEAVSDGLLTQTELGNEVINDIVYTWDFTSDPNRVTATIPLYNQRTFWYKFLDKESFEIVDISSRASFVDGLPVGTSTPTLSPLAINNCKPNPSYDATDPDSEQYIPRADDFNANPLTESSLLPLTVTFTTGPYYQDADTSAIYAVDPNCDDAAGDSNFAGFKNRFQGDEIDFVDYDVADNYRACLVQTSFQNPLTVDPNQLYNSMKHFTLPYAMDVLLFECGTDQFNLDVQYVLSLELTSVTLNKNVTLPDGENSNEYIMTFNIVTPGTEVILEY